MNELSVMVPMATESMPMSVIQGLPRDYLVFDSQTSGLDVDDVILSLSLMEVVDGKITAVSSSMLNWLRPSYGYTCEWLAPRLEESRPFHGIGLDQLQGGRDPREVLAEYRDRLLAIPTSSNLVGHSIFRFDLPILHRHIQKWLDGPGLSNRLPLFDLSVMERVMQFDIPCAGNESLFDLHRRVEGMAFPGGQWSLAYCLKASRAHVEVEQSHPLYNLYAARAIYEAVHRQLIGDEQPNMAG